VVPRPGSDRNEGWIKFEGGSAAVLKGKVSLAQVIQKLVG
jgi:hypothetical protein